MKIRTKLTFTFSLIVIVILTIVSIAIYYSSANYREMDFRRRLRNRGTNVANILLEFREVHPDLLRRMEKDNPASLPNQLIVVFDTNNTLIYQSDSTEVIPVDTELLNRVERQGEVRIRHNDYEILGFLITEGDQRYKVIAAAVDLYGYDALHNLRDILSIVFAVSIIVVTATGWVYAGGIVRPISRIVTEVDTITEASLDRRLDEGNRSDELDKLAQTFNRMLTRLEEAFLSQKNFIANASHELRTPIALIVAEIEATLINADKSRPHTEVLESLLESAKALNALANQLLLLAQTSTGQPEHRQQYIRVDEILWEAKCDVEKLHPEYSIDIHFALSLNDQSLIVRGDEQLLKIVFTNLIDNGCKYSFESSVHVTLNVSGRMVTIDFVNRGVGIPPEDVNRIFTPFFRGSNVAKIKGYGIGLSLASRIVELHRGSITLNARGTETCFSVTFPVAERTNARAVYSDF